MRKKIHVLDVMPIIIMLGLFVFFAIGSHGNTITLFNIKNIVIQTVPVALGALAE